jgi:NADH dehydrogenase FAD-containing subunit
MIEWLPSQFTGGIKSVDIKSKSVRTDGDTFKATVVNFIPPQMAGELAQQAGLADQSGWCPIEPTTFESKLQPGIHVVGDATSAGDMPKSAFLANSQAKACAFAIVSALTGSSSFAANLFNTCFTFLAGDDAVSDSIAFEPNDGTFKISDILISQVGEDAKTRRHAVQMANGWYVAFTHDVFG